jgi:hypothetical protein
MTSIAPGTSPQSRLALLEQAVLGQFLTVEILTDIRRRIERRAAGGRHSGV